MRHAEQVVVLTASPATIDRDGLHKTQPAPDGPGARRRRPVPGRLPGGRLPPGPVGARRTGRWSAATARSAAIAAASVIAKTARDRLMAGPMAEAYPRLRLRPTTSATRRPSTTPRCGPAGSRRSTAAPSSRWPIRTSIGGAPGSRLAHDAGVMAHPRPDGSEAHGDEVETGREPGEVRAARKEGLGRAADPDALGGRDRLRQGRRVRARLHLAEGQRRRRARPPGRARRPPRASAW